jgi:glycosyltransferase involved in cell wall biosynthesis
MNLLYAAFIREDSETKGFLKKVISQCNVFKKEFENVYLYISRKDEAVFYKVEKNGLQEIDTFKYNKLSVFDEESRIRKVRGFLRYNSFLKYLNEIINLYKIDILYLRNSHPTRKLMNILDNKKIIKLLEYPTYPYEEEYKKIQPKLERIIFRNDKRKRTEDIVDLVVGISGEKNLKVDEKFILINNGIQLNSVKVKKQNKKIYLNLLSIANVAFWHGYDRIIKGLHEYYKTNPEKEVFYHCVGEGSDLENLKTLVRELSLEKYVIFHGTKTGEDLDKVVDECDIAFGSLGFHRTGLTGGSPLKAREYCARGIPFVIAYEDWDFPKNFPFVYRIPKDDTPVDVSQVIKWYENLIKEHPNYSIEMRKYAEENLSWDAKMKPVIEKIKELAKEKERKPTT